MSNFEFLETRTRTTTISWLFICSGLVLVLVGNELSDNAVLISNVDVGRFISNAGAFVAIVALMQWLYDSFVRRKFFEEIITTVMATRSTYDAGIMEAFPNSTKSDHARSIIESTTLVLVFAHSKHFIDSYYEEFVARTNSGRKTLIYCNNPDSNASRYYIACGRKEAYVRSSVAELVHVANKLDASRNLVKIEYVNVIPKYALVMFDNFAYVIMATSSEGQATVPALVIRRGSPIWQFLQDDLDTIRANHCHAEAEDET